MLVTGFVGQVENVTGIIDNNAISLTWAIIIGKFMNINLTLADIGVTKVIMNGIYIKASLLVRLIQDFARDLMAKLFSMTLSKSYFIIRMLTTGRCLSVR